MKLSRYLLPTLREAPSDADNVSARLMMRAGMVRKVASGIYEWLPLGLRVLRKVERIVRAEMDGAGALEVSLPVIQPKSLWEETGRWQIYGKELLRIQDRKKTEFCFAPTAEEVITDLVRREVRSWRQLPMSLYQIGLKFRDEIRPRFGVMRAREFLMKDAYSFHADDASAEEWYWKFVEAYKKIFTRCGLRFKPVEAHSGAIGGSFSHEFMVLAETGEETVVSCRHCAYAANLERAGVAPAAKASPEGDRDGSPSGSTAAPAKASPEGDRDGSPSGSTAAPAKASPEGDRDGSPSGSTAAPAKASPEGDRDGSPSGSTAAPGAKAPPDGAKPLEEFSTPGLGSVADVAKLTGESPARFLKTQLYIVDSKPVMALLRGDHELNEAKLARATGSAMLRRMSDGEYETHMSCPVGFAGPQGREALAIYADFAVKDLANGITGANKKDLHARNVNPGRDYQPQGYFDLRSATPADPCPRCGKETEFAKGIEVGHTFKLGTKYAAALKAVYLDKEQKPQTMVMGCYGIGVSRVVAAAIEQGHDADGIVWTPALAPYHCSVIVVETDDAAVRQAADALISGLEALGWKFGG